jgi:hypothetical protein
MALLLRAVVPEKRGEFERHFWEVATIEDEERPDLACIGKTPLNWISWAYPVNIRSNYSMWAKRSRNPGRNLDP